MVEDLTDVVIRTARSEDASGIARVHVASWREAYTGVLSDALLAQLDLTVREQAWRETLDGARRGTKVWVAEENGHIVGFASLGPSRDEDADRDTLEIYTIYLEPSSWGQGVARELMRTVLAEVPPGTRVTLWVASANERARHFYRRNGFTADGVERVEEFGGEPVREVRYRRG